MTRITQEQRDSMCTFLKMIQEVTKEKPIYLKMYEEAKSYKIPYYACLTGILVKKGILARKKQADGKNAYWWATKTDPNRLMVDALLKDLRDLTIEKKYKGIITTTTEEIGDKPTFGITVVDGIKCIIKGKVVSTINGRECITISTSITELLKLL